MASTYLNRVALSFPRGAADRGQTKEDVGYKHFVMWKPIFA
jgi:hypothetical protein